MTVTWVALIARVELSILSLPFPTLTGSFSICAPSILM